MYTRTPSTLALDVVPLEDVLSSMRARFHLEGPADPLEAVLEGPADPLEAVLEGPADPLD